MVGCMSRIVIELSDKANENVRRYMFLNNKTKKSDSICEILEGVEFKNG
jgi:hypothetical protein